jgi:hypothetical protein
MPRSARLCILALCTAVGLALPGCNSGSSNSFNNGPPCALPANAQVALVYPAPGSTGNTTLLGQVIVASTATLPSTFDVVLTYAPSSVYGRGQYGGYIAVTTPPFPTPNTIPSFTNPIYYSSAFNSTAQQLPPGQVITANYNDIASNCTPTAISSFGT